MSLDVIAFLTLAAALIGFWWQSDKIKRLALHSVVLRCRAEHLQLLDQTLALRGVWPVRHDNGSLVLRRRYSFEFTSTGEMRHKGEVILHGLQVSQLHFDPYIMPTEPERLH